LKEYNPGPENNIFASGTILTQQQNIVLNCIKVKALLSPTKHLHYNSTGNGHCLLYAIGEIWTNYSARE